MDTIFTTIKRTPQFLRLVFRRFVEDQGLPNAASLTFATLLAIVPLMTVTLAVFSAFPIAERISEQLQNFIFTNFVPASSEVLQEYLATFSSKASSLSGAGFAFLVVVALMLMANIDRAFNTIWRVQQKRSALSMFIVYWAILTLGPLLIGLSVVVTSYLVSIPLFNDVEQALGFGRRLLGLTPVIASVVAFTLLYSVVPNRRVELKHAFAGGLLAAMLFELAKRGFAFYITQFPTYEAIYGAMAVVPIFLVWIYLCWVVTLLGAEFACCLALFLDHYHEFDKHPGGELLLTVNLLEQLWIAQKEGVALSLLQLSKRMGNVQEGRLEAVLNGLIQSDLVTRTERGDWILMRDLSSFSLWDLYSTRTFSLPSVAYLKQHKTTQHQDLHEIAANTEQYLQGEMSKPLDQFFDTDISKQSK